MGMIIFGNRSPKPARRAPGRPKRVEAIEMQAKRFGYFPRTFLWRGCRYDVHAVERCWTTGTRQRGGRVQRHHFRVRCVEGAFELFRDLVHNTWHIARFEPVG